MRFLALALWALASLAPAASLLQVLCYHRFAADCGKDPYCTSDAELAAQLAWLKAEGWQSVGLTQVAQALDGGPALPEKSVMLSVDDGYKAGARGADAFEAAGFKGVFFVNPGSLARGKRASRSAFLTMEALKDLERRGHEVGSHGLTHANLGKVPKGLDIPAYKAWLERELVVSRRELEDALGRPVSDLAWPYGAYNAYVIKAARRAGYRQIYTVTEACMDMSEPDRDRIPRILLMGRVPLKSFTARFAGARVGRVVMQALDGQVLTPAEMAVYDRRGTDNAPDLVDGVPRTNVRFSDLKTGFHFLQTFAGDTGQPPAFRQLIQIVPEWTLPYYQSLLEESDAP